MKRFSLTIAQAWRRHGLPFLVMGLAAVTMSSCGDPGGGAKSGELKFIIDQLDASAVPDTTARQKAINDIFSQCDAAVGTKMRATITKTNMNQNPDDIAGGVADTPDKRKALRTVALNGEIKTGGYKIWVAKALQPGFENGATVVSVPVSVIREQNDDNGDAQTWAHEIGHGLGLNHVNNDAGNLMFGSRKKADGTLAGSALGMVTDETGAKVDQCATMLAKAKALSPMTDPVHWLVGPTVSGLVLGTSVEIQTVEFAVDPDVALVGARINAGPLVLPDTVYRVWLDLDNNPATGDSNGYDAVLVGQLATRQATLVRLPSGGSTNLGRLVMESTFEEGTGPTSGSSTLLGIAVELRVPIALLGSLFGSLNPIRVLITSEANANGVLLTDSVGPELADKVSPPGPTLVLNPTAASVGATVTAIGSGFAPNSAFRILFDDGLVATGSADASGNFSVTFIVPSVPPGDYVVDAIDAAGGAQVASFTVR
jgi:hypothetical protein